MKVSDFIATFLRIQKTEQVFELAGGMITHLLDSMHQLGGTHIITMHHEQGASFAAEGYGRCKKRPGIALATSGPGATNLLTGIASCYFDSTPAIFITGQVNTHEQKGERLIRQLGFQETDIISMAKPITKKCIQVNDASEVESVMYDAFRTAINGRPGPVLIDLPMNIQRAEINPQPITYIEREESIAGSFEHEKLEQLSAAIQKAKKPLILVGNGVACSDSIALFKEFVDLLNLPVVTSLLARDALPYEHPLQMGMIGSYGNRWANIAIGNADLLLIIGSRLDIRQTGADIDGFARNKTIFHVDIDSHEINNRAKNCIPIVADVKDFLAQSLKYFSNKKILLHDEWMTEINQSKLQWTDVNELQDIKGINPNIFMHALSKASKDAVAYTADVGNHQMWAAQSLEIQKNQAFITSGGMGAMGFALPAGIGYSFASGKKPVVVIAGDGAFQLNMQELQTIVRNKLPVKIVVVNNQALGMIRQFQDSYFAGRYQSTYWGYNAPDFSKIAHAYDIPAKTISLTDEVEKACKWLWDEIGECRLLQVMIDPHVNVYPKIAFGKPITEMEPFFKPIEMEST